MCYTPAPDPPKLAIWVVALSGIALTRTQIPLDHPKPIALHQTLEYTLELHPSSKAACTSELRRATRGFGMSESSFLK